MSAIRLGTAACVLHFQSLSSGLHTSDDAVKERISPEALEDEHGRFRVWSGNLGALQKGHSSLDYRLRDSPLLQTNILKLLEELLSNLSEALAVVSGSRLPYEEQAKVESEDDDDDWSQNEEDSDEDDDGGNPKYELEQRFLDIVDIIDNLYKLSVRIRSPTLRSRSLKAASFRPVDSETGVDTFEQYALFDLQYTRELLAHLRPQSSEQADPADDYLVERLSKAITLRRRQFKYWRRHRDKLGASSAAAEAMLNPPPVTTDVLSPHITPENSNIALELTTNIHQPPSDFAPKSMLSGTEATQHHRSLDEIVDSQSVTSYATTTRDLTGRGIELPPPPKQATEDKDFECPYCYIICPARYGSGRAWRTHLLQDLQPYICTYEDCPSGDQLFRSRREWIEHEAGHRKLWRCPEHKNAIYRSSSALEDHLHSEHPGSFPEDQIKSIIRVGETSSVDLRPKCPLCLADATMEGGLQNHIANHMERFSAFALPKDIDTAEDHSDGASSIASRGRSEAYSASQDPSTDAEDEKTSTWDWEEADLPSRDLLSKLEQLAGKMQEKSDVSESPGTALSTDLLNLIPDSSQQRMDVFLSSREYDDEGDEFSEAIGHSLRNRGLDPITINPSIERNAEYEEFMEKLEKYHEKRGTHFEREPKVGDWILDLLKLYKRVVEEGGYDKMSNTREKPHAWRRLARELFPGSSTFAAQAFQLKTAYYKNLAAYEISDIHKREPPPKEILEEVSAKGGDLLDRTLDNYIQPPESGEVKVPGATDDDASEDLEQETAPTTRTARLLFENIPQISVNNQTALLQQFLETRPGYRSMSGLEFSGGKCSGYAKFTDLASATAAFEAIDDSKFPGVVFGVTVKKTPNARFEDFDTLISGAVDEEESDSEALFKVEPQRDTDGQSVPEPNPPTKVKAGILLLSEIPTLEQLYASKRPSDYMPQRDPNEVFNKKVSFVLNDITKLQVDVIVNAASRNLSRRGSELRKHIDKIAGPGLEKEINSIGENLATGEVMMTDAYQLPCKKIFHAARPQYATTRDKISKSQLADCYQRSLNMAEEFQLKTIAFPTLSAGGYGFPPHMAATVAISVVRRYLDSGNGLSLDRIIFCVFTERDRLAYEKVLPMYFPPTSDSSSALPDASVESAEQSDLSKGENVELSPKNSSKALKPYSEHLYSAYAKELGEVRDYIEEVAEDLVVFRNKVPDFQESIIRELTFIASTLAELENFFVSSSTGSVSDMTESRTSDLDLICLVLRSAAGSVHEIIMHSIGVLSHKDIWESYNFHLKNSQGLTFLDLVELCGNFIQSLSDILKWNGREPDDMGLLRDRLSRYRIKQSEGGVPHVPTAVFDEALLTREFTAEVSELNPQQSSLLRASQIPSLSRLYQIGLLDEVPTSFSPNNQANGIVCLIRHDITRLQVDAIVNSTDMAFTGLGTLDRAIFKAAGLTMQEDCAKFGILKQGGVRLSQGYLLPCLHVIHAVPPEDYNERSVPLLRKCYQDALNMVVDIGARTVAFPAIGTGELRYPSESATIALDEVRSFLDQNRNTKIERIIFCLYTESDESMYKALIPQFFPPVDTNVNKAVSALKGQDVELYDASKEAASEGRRVFVTPPTEIRRGGRRDVRNTIFIPRKSRPPNTDETQALDAFEAHTTDCEHCRDTLQVYRAYGKLCPDGHRLAQDVADLLFAESDDIIYSTALDGGRRVEVSLGGGYIESRRLLSAINWSLRQPGRTPFDNMSLPYTPSSIFGQSQLKKPQRQSSLEALYSGTLEANETPPNWKRTRTAGLEPDELFNELEEKYKESPISQTEYFTPAALGGDSGAQSQKSDNTNEESYLVIYGKEPIAIQDPTPPDRYVNERGERTDEPSTSRKNVTRFSAPPYEQLGDLEFRAKSRGNLPTEQLDDHYSYTDPAGMYRDTEPAWRGSREPTNLKPSDPDTKKSGSIAVLHRAAQKSILRPPTSKFPEDPNVIREGVAPLKDSRAKDVPEGARWTKIDRRLVNPQALEEAKERFEERIECVIVLRVLTKEEIQKLVDRTQQIRDARIEGLQREERRRRMRRGSLDNISKPTNEEPPPGAQWTKIDRKLVSPEALKEANERYEERIDCVIVLRALSEDEIQALADRTTRIRNARPAAFTVEVPTQRSTVQLSQPPPKSGVSKGVPPGARWTKIDRRLVNPEALTEAGENFEERADCVIVFRVLTKEEIQKLADRTWEIRLSRSSSELEGKPRPERRGTLPEPNKPNLQRRGSLPETSKPVVEDIICWTPLDRRLVSLEALKEANEAFEERFDVVVVLRDLNDAEIRSLTDRTTQLRNASPAAFTVEGLPQHATGRPTSTLPQPQAHTTHPRASTAPPHALPSSYINQVKATFANQPDVVEKFEQVLRDYRSGRIDSPDAVYRISSLFEDRPELIQGFNIFLPPGYRTEAAGQPLSMPQPQTSPPPSRQLKTTLEDEPDVVSDELSGEAFPRGAVDQTPILLEVEPKERRFVLVPEDNTDEAT